MQIRFHKIRHKLLFAFFSIVLLAGVIGLVAYINMQHIAQYQLLRNELDELLILNLEIKKDEQNFILYDTKNPSFMQTGESEHLSNFKRNSRAFKHLLQEVSQKKIAQDLQVQANLKSILELHRNYAKTFDELIDKIQRRGYKDNGLEGKMREVVHNLEKNYTIDESLLLTLRRHEKDFIIRKDLDYVFKVRETAEKIKRRYYYSPSILQAIDMYLKEFEKLVAVEKEIGLSDKIGIRGKLNKASYMIELEVSSMHYLVNQRTESLVKESATIIVVSIFVLLILAALVAVYFAFNISNPIILINRISKSVTKGIRNQEVFLDEIKSKDELGSLAQNFKTMLITLKKTIKQINERNQQLQEIAKIEAQRTWHSEGLAIFGEILKNHGVELEQQAYEIISALVKYLNANQGGLFVVNRDNEQEPYLELKGCYAYERKKYQQKRIEMGEGLVGTAWREGETIFINDVPKSYAKITSGLGEALPTNLLIVPVKLDDDVHGVIEIISFKEFTKPEINFVEQLSQRIATALIAIQNNERTKKLLKSLEETAKNAEEREAEMEQQLETQRYWVHQVERKLDAISEEAAVYQAIINKAYAGIILTDERFRITKVNNYILKRFNYKKKDIEGQVLDVLIETDYKNVIDLKDKRFSLNYQSFGQKSMGKLIDKNGNIVLIETLAGKLELGNKIIYVFLFNECESLNQTRPKEFFSSQNPYVLLN
ncbi:MAG: GAF domain-containing protein [Microscillaceae bacterium]|nr:GAF domain-containing protein [Microscillaceae bacterium]MDW8459724.1 GAF domain-containing protein [Cytophagales bacterium]